MYLRDDICKSYLMSSLYPKYIKNSHNRIKESEQYNYEIEGLNKIFKEDIQMANMYWKGAQHH